MLTQGVRGRVLTKRGGGFVKCWMVYEITKGGGGIVKCRMVYVLTKGGGDL